MIYFSSNRTLNWTLNDMLDLAARLSSDNVLAAPESGLPFDKEQTIDYIDEQLARLSETWPEVYNPSILFELAHRIDILFPR